MEFVYYINRGISVNQDSLNRDLLNRDSLNQDLSVPPNNSRRCKSSHDTFIHEKSYYMHAILWHMSAFHFSGDFFCNPKNILTTHTPPLFILKYVANPPPSNKELNLDRPEVNSSPKFLKRGKSKTRPIELRIYSRSEKARLQTQK